MKTRKYLGKTFFLSILLAYAHVASAQQDAVIVDHSGNVGIGTPTPRTLLDVNGNMNVRSIGDLNIVPWPNLKQLDDAKEPYAGWPIFCSGAGDYHFRSYWGFSFDLNNGNVNGNSSEANARNTRIPGACTFTINKRTSATEFSTLFTVRSSGNVGIGKTDPQQKLEVDGNIKATGDLVTGGSVKDATGYLVPRGGIIMYSGNYNEFFDQNGKGKPGSKTEGWMICDGRNGTPNLVGKVVLGTGPGSLVTKEEQQYTYEKGFGYKATAQLSSCTLFFIQKQ